MWHPAVSPPATVRYSRSMDLALFDFDGTITSRDTMPDFIHAAAPRWRRGLGTVLLAPVLLGYRAGWVSGVAARAAVVAVAFGHARSDAYDAHGERFARHVLPSLVRADAMARIDWHRGRGDTVVVVSGGLDAYLAPWAASHGLPLLCSTLARRDGRLTGRYAGRQCVRAEKAHRVREAFDLAAFDRIHAYGDTAEDAAMLALAHEPHFRRMPAAA